MAVTPRKSKRHASGSPEDSTDPKRSRPTTEQSSEADPDSDMGGYGSQNIQQIGM